MRRPFCRALGCGISVIAAVIAASLAGCTEQKATPEGAKFAPISFAAIEHWGEGHQTEALAAFRRSQSVIVVVGIRIPRHSIMA